MAEPIVYLSTWRIKEGRFDDYRRFYDAFVAALRDVDRNVVAFFAFGNDDNTEITNVHVYSDATTLEEHMAILAEQMGLLPGELSAVFELMEPLGVQVYGEPTANAEAMDQSLKDAGVPFTGKRHYLGGFSLADRAVGAASG